MFKTISFASKKPDEFLPILLKNNCRSFFQKFALLPQISFTIFPFCSHITQCANWPKVSGFLIAQIGNESDNVQNWMQKGK